jgi:hypothetical protein
MYFLLSHEWWVLLIWENGVHIYCVMGVLNNFPSLHPWGLGFETSSEYRGPLRLRTLTRFLPIITWCIWNKGDYIRPDQWRCQKIHLMGSFNSYLGTESRCKLERGQSISEKLIIVANYKKEIVRDLFS